MAGVVKAMDSAMRSMNLEKISALMDKFEKQFEDLDVQSSCMDTAMSQTTTTNVPQNDVDFLMQQVADEAGYSNYFKVITCIFEFFYDFFPITLIFRIELNMELPQGQTSTLGASTTVGASTQASTEQDELTQRLARLRQI
jgi:charged multivesicular body protein 1